METGSDLFSIAASPSPLLHRGVTRYGLAHVGAFDRAGEKHDAVAVLDTDSASAAYGTVVGWTDVPSTGPDPRRPALVKMLEPGGVALLDHTSRAIAVIVYQVVGLRILRSARVNPTRCGPSRRSPPASPRSRCPADFARPRSHQARLGNLPTNAGLSQWSAAAVLACYAVVLTAAAVAVQLRSAPARR